MKKLYLLSSALMFMVFTKAQQSPVAAGGVATGTNGTVSFSIGQLVDDTYSSSSNTITPGVQQPYEISTPLPLQWLSFSANLQGNQALLTWKTAHEQNTNHFEVEKKAANSSDFFFVALLATHLNSRDGAYHYADNTLTEGVTYYRLKEVDNNGLDNYSQVVFVNLQSANAATLKVYPNPVVTQMNIVFNATENKTYQLELVDASGRRVITKQITCTKGNNSINWNVAQLATGEYTLKAVGADVLPFKIIK